MHFHRQPFSCLSRNQMLYRSPHFRLRLDQPWVDTLRALAWRSVHSIVA
jgi:hypothetical protein